MVTQNKVYSFLFTGVLALMMALAVAVPRALSFAPGLAGVVFTAVYWLAGRRAVAVSRPLLVIVGVTLVLAASSVLWSVAPDVSQSKLGKVALVLVPCAAFINLALKTKIEALAPYAWLIPAVLLVFCALLAVEIHTGGPVFHWVNHVDPHARFGLHVYNRGIISAVLCFFPAHFLLRRVTRPLVADTLFALVFAALLVGGDSQGAQLALVLGLFVMLVFPYRAGAAWRALAGLLAGLILAAPFLAMWMFHRLAPVLDTMPFFGEGEGFAGARLEIWDYISRYALAHPLLGSGLEATRTIKDFDSAQIYIGGTSILHPHNFALQLWMEFGVLGAALGAGLCIYLLQAIRGLAPAQARIVLPAFISCVSAAAMTYGLWQSWWTGLLCFVAFLCVLAVRIAAADEAGAK